MSYSLDIACAEYTYLPSCLPLEVDLVQVKVSQRRRSNLLTLSEEVIVDQSSAGCKRKKNKEAEYAKVVSLDQKIRCSLNNSLATCKI